MIITLCAIATIAFFLPLLAEIDQNFGPNHVLFERDIAQDTSHKADLMCGLPFTIFSLFFYQHFHCYQEITQPMTTNVSLSQIGPYPLLSLQ
ncbi:MAG: hypothetical protein K0S34_2149 [Bacillales bacterium]|nr:hypothetical protein [Bacillales bacterium]